MTYVQYIFLQNIIYLIDKDNILTFKDLKKNLILRVTYFAAR